MFCSGIQVILRLSSQKLEGFQCWYSEREKFMIQAVEMASGGMITYLQSSMKFSTGVQKLLGGMYTHTHSMEIS
jgi:hypothetical protein